jgi:hypothetical protein
MSLLNRRSAAPIAAIPLVVVHEHLIVASRRQIQASPRAETGGKFLGFIIGPRSQPPETPYGRAVADVWRKLAAGGGALLLVGSISPGPRAESTEVELFPDAKFQGSVFQALEVDEPSLHHLGSWHSHHPNGLPHFSPGDLAHYRSVMESEKYEPDYFVAGLCVDARGLLSGGVFEIFGRGGFRQALPADRIKTLTGYPSLQTVVDATERTVAARLAGTSSGAADRMAAALSKRFAVQGRDEDDKAVSWIITDRTGLGFQGVVTWAKGADGPVEVALEISRENGTLRYEGPVSGDPRALADPLWKLMKELDSAKRAAGRQR